jgi:hypothetical protein
VKTHMAPFTMTIDTSSWMDERTQHRHTIRLRPVGSGGTLARVIRTLSATALVATMLGAGAGSVLAFGTAVPCTSRSEAAVFANWSDTFNYFLTPNGGFESGTTDWALTGGATVVSGNESYRVGGATDAKSLRIPSGATAESRTICVSRGEDTIRLFVNNARVAGSILHVEAIVRSSSGQIAQTAFDVNGDAAPAGWAPTMRLGIPNLLGGSGSEELTLRFTTRGTAATWNIDDVYVDPYKSY